MLLLSRVAVIATAAMFGLTYSLSAPLIAFRLQEDGLDESWIGVNAAMHAVGVLLIAPVLPLLVARFGVRRLILGALLLAALVLVGFAVSPAIWLWFVLRVLLGVASEMLFVLSETWTSHLSTEATRARSMAAYMAGMSLGFAAGPLLLSATGVSGMVPFLAGVVPLLAAMLLIVAPQVVAPAFGPAEAGANPSRYLRLAPVAMAATMLNAAVETSGLSFLALYAMSLGWSEPRATYLLSAMMVGAIVLQLPIGWLGDRMSRPRLVSVLALLAAAGALIWPLVLNDPPLALSVVFLWGGVFVGIYTLMLTIVGSRFQGAELVGIYGVMGLIWGAGALVGPVLAGAAMDATRHGLPLFVALACLLFLAFIGISGKSAQRGATTGAPASN
jgi:MFS family permease